MAQLSRPYQIALAAMAVLALVWFVALHGHTGGSSEPSPSISSSKPSSSGSASSSASNSGSSSATAKAQERQAAKSTPIYKGPAPGVEGLTRDIAKAHGAVASSQRNGAELQHKSAQASNETSGAQSGSAVSGGSRTSATHPKSAPASAPAVKQQSVSRPSAPTTPSKPAQQVQVERELTHGKTVMLVFWNPSSSVDSTVRSQALALSGSSKGKVVVHVARANQVGLFGPVTEVAHVYETPTILIIARRGEVTTLTGLIDAYGLRQALREAEHAAK